MKIRHIIKLKITDIMITTTNNTKYVYYNSNIIITMTI